MPNHLHGEENKIKTHDPYQRTAAIYDIFVEPFNGSLRQIAIKLFPPQTGNHILEIGCGTGANLERYQQAGCHVYGIDLSPSMIEVSRNKLGGQADLRLGSAAEMPFPNDFFDLSIAMLTLHEMSAKIRKAVIDEMIRVIKPEGSLLLVDFHPGPIIFPKGWISKSIILFFEISAGREHFRNYRDFIAGKGLPSLLSNTNLSIVKEKIVAGGNMALFLARRKEAGN